MELIAKKNHTYSEELKSLIKGLEKIDQDIKNDTKILKRSRGNLDIEKYFMQIYYIGEFIKQMYPLNDYEASMKCCKYLMPRIEGLIDYVTKRLHNSNQSSTKDTKLLEWIYKEDDMTTYIRRGQKQKCGRLQYIYDVMYWDYMKIAARYSIHWLINYMEKDKLRKDYPSRERVLASYVHYANSMLLNRFDLKWQDEDVVPTKIIFSTMPSSGKSFVNNVANLMGSILGALYLSIGGILRVGNEQGNIFRQSAQTKNMLENPLILDVYPELKDLTRGNGKYDPYSKSSEEEWGIRDVKNDPATTVFKTRDSAINSVRCYILAIMDDPSRGQEECNNINIHQMITQKFNGDFQDRFKSQDDMAILLTGTMFNPYDVFSIEIQKAIAKGVYKDEKHINTLITNDKKTVIIVNDCEDEYGNSEFPEFISTESLKDKKNNLDAYTYACVWRQHPIPADGLLFDDTLLQHYDTIDLTKFEDYSFAYIDPTRKSNKDFLSMPIMRKNKEDGKFYLIDVIFDRVSTKDCYDDIINKIKSHKIINFVIEENTSADLETVIKDRLKQQNINYCNVSTIYNTINKQQRIADMAGTAKSNIVFPMKNKYNPRVSQIGNFMNWLCQYSNVDANNHDDAPDSLCGFTKAFILDTNSINIVKGYKTLPF